MKPKQQLTWRYVENLIQIQVDHMSSLLRVERCPGEVVSALVPWDFISESFKRAAANVDVCPGWNLSFLTKIDGVDDFVNLLRKVECIVNNQTFRIWN